MTTLIGKDFEILSINQLPNIPTRLISPWRPIEVLLETVSRMALYNFVFFLMPQAS